MKIKGYTNSVHLMSFINKTASTLRVFPTKSDYYTYEIEIDAEKYNTKADGDYIVISHLE